MGDFALKFRAHFWLADWETAFGRKGSEPKKSEATTLIYNALNKAKIEIPFPTHTVLVSKEK
jgi:small-conductance mechanosensitive channel